MKKSFLYLLTLSTLLFFGCSGDKMQMLRQLEQLEATNRSGEPLLNDTLAEQLVDYFDRHGDSNERMRAKYMLGRTYFCLGELPRALETYIEAAGCADTTSEDCNYKVLSRVHAQSAVIFNQQVQPLSQLKELRLAVYYAKKGNDTLISIECLAQQADAYDFMHNDDSVIIIKKKASALFTSIHREDRAAQTVIPAVSSLVKKGQLDLARQWIQDYEAYSGNFDTLGNIEKGREVYYYIKGEYCLAINAIDSAEYLFRKELRDGKDLNNQIAGSKGLQKVFERRHNPDSIAKYANLSYELNDSAYSLSEMQNIQKFQASYNYSHSKLVAEQKTLEVERVHKLLVYLISIVLVIIIVGLFFFISYRNEEKQRKNKHEKDLEDLAKLQRELIEICSDDKLSQTELFEKKNVEISELLDRVVDYKQREGKKNMGSLEERLSSSEIVILLKQKANANPYHLAGQEDFRRLRNLINEEIPLFYSALNSPQYTLTAIEYDVSLLIRVRFSPTEIQKLTGLSSGYIANIRSRLLQKVFGQEGSPKEYDQRVIAIM